MSYTVIGSSLGHKVERTDLNIRLLDLQTQTLQAKDSAHSQGF